MGQNSNETKMNFKALKPPKKQKEKTKWAKFINRDEAYELGKEMGMRITLQILFDEMGFDKEFIVYLIEDYIIKKKEFKKI